MGVTGVVAVAVVAGVAFVAGVVVVVAAVEAGGGEVLVASGVRVARSVCAAIKRAAMGSGVRK